MKRRDFLKASSVMVSLPTVLGAPLLADGRRASTRKMLIVGFDGLDPAVMTGLMKLGKLPNFSRFAEQGGFGPMLSTAPPESPTAWASFATGLDPAGHGVFGFLHRNPSDYMPFSTSAPVAGGGKTIDIGSWRLPLSSGESRLYRKGRPFWDFLADRELESTIVKLPSNYPAEPMRRGRALAGMGTPDIYGGHGTFTLYSTREEDLLLDLGDKGHVYPAFFDLDHRFSGQLEGPLNSLKIEPEPTFMDFTVYWDRGHKTARIDIDGREILLEQGKLSPWISLSFALLSPLASVSAITRFQLLEADRNFRLYVYPPSIDPADPAQAISSPASYCQDLCRSLGRFHTLGLPADFNGVKTEVLSLGDFITQSDAIMAESRVLFDYEFDRFRKLKSGLLFFYFSSADQGSHIFWALRDPQHPAYRPAETREFGDQIACLYQQFDDVVGLILDKLPASLPVMLLSDHGFAPLRRQVNLNTFLYRHGLLRFHGDPDYGTSLLNQADWQETRAYALGLNGIYLNQAGREGAGIVPASRRREELQAIAAALLGFRDPLTGLVPFAKVFLTEEMYRGEYLGLGPDLIVGCNSPYGLDYGAATGGIRENIVDDNRSRWSGDHIIDPHQVPAMLMTNFRRRALTPVIWDMAPTILDMFGHGPVPAMRGKSIL